eukprot:CAMPEP_0184865166 /NCGR_PEP_ID=MMETSP0580-20130426/17199_1 /TAXON_ID=1118495 /ORGANISM="Dactyliosolen fragilissimus" /LENGTH=373 /DNA_ID=CAMNT_0027364261 /DNA_START=309 /DNA_END=1430 /DNA_ORIENTATION=+
MSSSSKHILYDMPVSNNGARCRLILYKKKIPKNEVDILPPSTLGGLKSPDYLSLNAQGKMPLLEITPNNAKNEVSMGENNMSNSMKALPESDTICRYLLSTYKDIGPSFLPDDTKSNLISRLHDMYLTTIQGCMYKATPPFGIYQERKDAIEEFRRQMQIIDDLIGDDHGMYLCGDEVSLADATLFPTMIFANFMLPKFGVKKEDALPSRIAKWYKILKERDGDFAKIYEEVLGGLLAWEDNNRWDIIPLAGKRDNDPPTIFDKIISGDIPSTIVRDDDKILAFKDINPAAPAHILVIPKDRNGLSALRKSEADHGEILGKMLLAAGDIARDKSLGFGDGARIVINDGKDGGQEVPHIHIHVLGGRLMQWPPG